MASKKNPQERFREFAAHVPPLPTSLLATASAPLPASPATRRAAKLMVGDLASEDGRVDRIAANLERLIELNQRQTAKQRRGSGR